MTIKSGRLKWYGLSFIHKRPSINNLSSLLRDMSFLPNLETSKGFKVEAIGTNYISAKFISKDTIEQTINLPTGGELVQIITNISTVDFVIELDDTCYIRVENPPRSILSLFNHISQAFEYQCSIEPIEVNVGAMLDFLKKKLTNVAVTYMDVSNISLGRGVQLRVAAAGESGVEDELNILLDEKSSIIEGVKLKYLLNGAPASIEATRRAGLKIASQITAIEFDIFREAITQSKL